MTRPAFTDDITDFLGFRLEAPGRIRLTVRPELMNGGGILSGIVPFGLIDYAMGSALWKEITEEESIATLNIAINYVATALEGDIVCSASVDRRTRTNAVMRSEVSTVTPTEGPRLRGPEDETGQSRLLATAIGSYAIFPRKRLGPRAVAP
jgi:acyl-coenzyme A thioesterase PaaI-like protein